MRTILYLLFTMFAFFSCKQNNPRVIILTEMGEIELEIYTDKAPVSASHFLLNVDAGVYDHSFFYRTVNANNQPNNEYKIAVIQGGLFHDSLVAEFPVIPHETTKETGIRHKDGIISFARMEPGTQSTEFFICIGDQAELDYGGRRNPDGQGFSAFGGVLKGRKVIKQIQYLPSKEQMLEPKVKILKIIRKGE